MTPDEKLLIQVVRWLNSPRYSPVWFWVMLVIAGFVGHFL